LKLVNTKYVLFTLDDYFLTEPIKSEQINMAIKFMDEEKVDYLRLYPATQIYLKKEKAKESKVYPGYYIRNLDSGDYKVSLYPGIWNVDFMNKTLNRTMNAWQYEVALTEMARKEKAVCAISNHREYPFLDVIRKGKVLRKANAYFKKNHLFQNSSRKIMKWYAEWFITVKTFLRRYLPRKMFLLIKRTMIKHGKEFYSPVD